MKSPRWILATSLPSPPPAPPGSGGTRTARWTDRVRPKATGTASGAAPSARSAAHAASNLRRAAGWGGQGASPSAASAAAAGGGRLRRTPDRANEEKRTLRGSGRAPLRAPGPQASPSPPPPPPRRPRRRPPCPGAGEGPAGSPVRGRAAGRAPWPRAALQRGGSSAWTVRSRTDPWRTRRTRGRVRLRQARPRPRQQPPPSRPVPLRAGAPPFAVARPRGAPGGRVRGEKRPDAPGVEGEEEAGEDHGVRHVRHLHTDSGQTDAGAGACSVSARTDTERFGGEAEAGRGGRCGWGGREDGEKGGSGGVGARACISSKQRREPSRASDSATLSRGSESGSCRAGGRPSGCGAASPEQHMHDEQNNGQRACTWAKRCSRRPRGLRRITRGAALWRAWRREWTSSMNSWKWARRLGPRDCVSGGFQRSAGRASLMEGDG